MREIQRGVDLIQDIHRRWLELEEGEDEGKSDERTLTTAQLGQTLLPHLPQADFDLQPIADLLALRWIEFGKASGQQVGKDGSKVAVDFGPRLVQSLLLVLVQAGNRLLDFPLVADDGLHHVLEGDLLLLDAVNHVHDFRVDLLLHALEAFRDVPQGRLALADILTAKVVRRLRPTKALLFVGDPLMLLFHLSQRLSGMLLILLEFVDLVRNLLNLKTVLGDA